MEKEFEGRVAVIIGASSGIGRGVAERLVDAGAMVSLFARSAAALERMASMNPERLLAVAGDAARSDDLERLFGATEAKFGSCELLVNTAGTIEPKRIEQLTIEEWDAQFAVNIRGVFLACKRAIPGMIHRGGGAIVNVASISGIPGPQKFPGFSAYCASKAAVISFTECLAVELKRHGIRVNAISPGSVDTPMLRQANPDLQPDMTPDEVGEAILFLLSSRSRPIDGQNLHVFSA